MRVLLTGLCLLLIASPLVATEGYLLEGAKYFQAGNYDKAIRAYALAVNAKQDSAEAYKWLGLAYYRRGSFGVGYDVEMISAAVDALKRSLAIKSDADVYYHLGLSYLILYDKENADMAYRDLQSVDPDLAEKLAEKMVAYVKPPRLNLTPSTASRSDVTAVVINGNTVLVPVTFSYRGNSVQAMLVLDTGASVTTISERVAARLGVDPKETRALTGVVADGRQVDGRWFVADSLVVGPKNLPQLPTAILPGAGPAGYDGLLGMNFLKKFRYHVDFNRSVIDWNR